SLYRRWPRKRLPDHHQRRDISESIGTPDVVKPGERHSPAHEETCYIHSLTEAVAMGVDDMFDELFLADDSNVEGAGASPTMPCRLDLDEPSQAGRVVPLGPQISRRTRNSLGRGGVPVDDLSSPDASRVRIYVHFSSYLQSGEPPPGQPGIQCPIQVQDG